MTTTATAPASVPPGLRGVNVTDTEIGDVRGLEGFYHYRQYSATELAQKRSLEDVWRLLLDGELPANRQEAEAFAAEVRQGRGVPDAVMALLPGIATASQSGGALDGLRTSTSLLGSALGLRPLWDLKPRQRRTDLLRLAAATPTLVAALYRLGCSLEPIPPDPGLGHAANYLWMVTGSRPDPAFSRAPEQYLILTVDHGFN